GEQDLDQHSESFRVMSEEAGGSAMDIVAAGMKVDVSIWLAERAEEIDCCAPTSGVWPEGELGTHHFTLPIDAEHGTPLPRVFVALVPTVIGWQVPAYLRFGGWNSCPAPEHHVAMLKHWRHLYGAEVVGVGGEVLELANARPPADRDVAMRLAREQFI